MTSANGSARTLQVAVVAAGNPADPTTWSGTPRGLIDGFSQLGHNVVPIDALPSRLPKRLAQSAITARRTITGPRFSPRNALWASKYGFEWSQLLSATAQKRLRHIKPDLVVQAGEGWAVRHPRVALYLDMTTSQAIEHQIFVPPVDISTLDAIRLRTANRAFRRVAYICAATPWAADSVVRDHGLPPTKVHSVGIGSRPLEQTHTLRDFNRPRFLFVGSRWERKNGPAVLSAFRRLREEHDDATLDVVGDHPPIDEPGVTAHGFLARNNPEDQRRLAHLYSQATCLVVPGAFEAAGIVFTEAAQHGIPSICGSVGGAKDIVGPGGIDVTPGDITELYAAMNSVIGHNGARMGRLAAQRSELFTWPAVAQRILEATKYMKPDSAAKIWPNQEQVRWS